MLHLLQVSILHIKTTFYQFSAFLWSHAEKQKRSWWGNTQGFSANMQQRTAVGLQPESFCLCTSGPTISRSSQCLNTCSQLLSFSQPKPTQILKITRPTLTFFRQLVWNLFVSILGVSRDTFFSQKP